MRMANPMHRFGIGLLGGALALGCCGLALGQAAPDGDQPPPAQDSQQPPRPDRAPSPGQMMPRQQGRQHGPPPTRGMRPHGPPVSLKGTVQAFNSNPDGMPESMMLKTNDQLVQVNFPPPVSGMIDQVAPVGSEVQVQAAPELGLPDHPVYELCSLKSDKTEKSITMPKPGEQKKAHAEGTIKQLNYGQHGEINGALLDDGTIVRFPPDAAAAAKLDKGQKITVDGMSRTTLDGHQCIEATSLNGKTIEHPMRGRRPMGAMGPMGPRRGGADGAGPGGGPGGRKGPGGPERAGRRPPPPGADNGGSDPLDQLPPPGGADDNGQ